MYCSPQKKVIQRLVVRWTMFKVSVRLGTYYIQEASASESRSSPQLQSRVTSCDGAGFFALCLYLPWHGFELRRSH